MPDQKIYEEISLAKNLGTQWLNQANLKLKTYYFLQKSFNGKPQPAPMLLMTFSEV